MFDHLPLIDLLLHGTLSQKSVDINRFLLTKTIGSKNGLSIMAETENVNGVHRRRRRLPWIPACIEDDHSVAPDEIDANATRERRNEEQASA